MRDLILLLAMVCSIVSSTMNCAYEEKNAVVTDNLVGFEIEVSNPVDGVSPFAEELADTLEKPVNTIIEDITIEATDTIIEPADTTIEPIDTASVPFDMCEYAQERLIMESVGVDIPVVDAGERITQDEVDTYDVVYSIWKGQYHVTGHSNLTMGNIKNLKVGDVFWLDSNKYQVIRSTQGRLTEDRTDIIADDTGYKCLYNTDVYMVTCHREKYGADGRWVVLGKTIFN